MIHYSQDKKTSIITITIEGKIATKDVTDAFAKLRREHGDKKTLYVISDYSNGGFVEEPDLFLVNMTEIKNAFEAYFSSLGNFYSAYIIPPENENTMVLIKFFINLVKNIDSFKVAFFENKREANKWLQNHIKNP